MEEQGVKLIAMTIVDEEDNVIGLLFRNGEHAGHEVILDYYATDILGADPKRSFYCKNCKESIKCDLVDVSDGGQDGSN